MKGRDTGLLRGKPQQGKTGKRREQARKKRFANRTESSLIIEYANRVTESRN